MSMETVRVTPARIRRGLDGWRKSGGSHADRLHRHLRSRAVPGIWRSQPHGASPSDNFFRCLVLCLCGEPPRVDSVASEVDPRMLSARIRKERRSAGAPSFTLDVSVEVSPGITILFGASGAGKSTLLDCLAGLAQPAEGRIAIGNDILFDSSAGVHVPAPKRRIAYVFQTLA